MMISIFWNKIMNNKVVTVLGIAVLSISLLSGCSNSDNDPKFVMEVKGQEYLTIKPGSQEFRIILDDVKITALSKGNDKQMEQIKKVYEITEGNRCFLEGRVTTLKNITKSKVIKTEPTRLVCAVKGEFKSITFDGSKEYYKGDLKLMDVRSGMYFGFLPQYTRDDSLMLLRNLMSGVLSREQVRTEEIVQFEKMLEEEKSTGESPEIKNFTIGLDNYAPIQFIVKTLSEIGVVKVRAVLENYESLQ